MGIGQDGIGGKRPALSWTGGVPVAEAFGDPYYSLNDGLAETRHVFLAGNGLPGRLGDGFRVAELGFGTGLNALALAEAWQGPGRIAMTSFEAFPMGREDMVRALSAHPVAHDLREALLAAWPARRIALGGVDLEIVPGDARETLPAWEERADAWFLDGFAPARNPELWGEELMRQVARHTAPGGSFATYTAAGHVRRALAAAGFEVERVPGYGRKRHMSRGVLR
ncbi:tRNA (5-methylaminomethyl-2-thiouridine)(34)-methyltransferase MnmD [Jannaschia formosa]|uniref:tRNA (5-methylaminomethyl-2-thiouridine)(34)-methyltransferase MnmD n=1 Tax=Jannaschia formosa TaxID=2259592 RepID=UPI000E1BF5B8|nr:tRNA (5-methylaminomethyl-2-thiouridine)(34)-methyltransferase MnmD [Jannaschia formosa]TFL18840.1 FAD-dependent oxidoreductase [Jannaschia formosa]